MSLLQFFKPKGKSRREESASSSSEDERSQSVENSALQTASGGSCKESVVAVSSATASASPGTVAASLPVRNDVGELLKSGHVIPDDVKFSVLKEPFVPDKKFVFPSSSDGRSFQRQWLERYHPWLVFSPRLSGGTLPALRSVCDAVPWHNSGSAFP